MTERPILMNADSVRAILEGRKTQTRRVIKPQPKPDWAYCFTGRYLSGKTLMIPTAAYGYRDTWKCPYGAPGDILYVRETTWRNGGYVATDPPSIPNDGKVPSIHMPRWASRLTLKVKKVTAARVQDISPWDCIREGLRPLDTSAAPDPRARFASLWNEINAGRGFSWEVNPWVWAIAFEVVNE